MIVSFAPLDSDAVQFLSEETGIDFSRQDFSQPHWFCLTTRRDDGTMMGVLACEFKTWFDVHFSAAICDARFMSRKLLATIFRALFSQATRITALVSPDNEGAVDIVRRLGFVYEGFLRMGVEGRRDALMFGMLRDDCRFLPGYHPAKTSIRPLNIGGFHGLHS